MSDPGVSLALPVGMSSTTESEECSGQDSVVNCLVFLLLLAGLLVPKVYFQIREVQEMVGLCTNRQRA